MVPVIFGTGVSLITIVGAHAGAGLRRQAISIAWKGVLINTAIIGVVGVFFALYPDLWCSFGARYWVAMTVSSAAAVSHFALSHQRSLFLPSDWAVILPARV